jgi:isocitrate lyase
MEQAIKFIDAVIKLRPNSIGKFATSGIEITEWHDENNTQPTNEEVLVEMARQEAEYNNNEYQRNRAQNYPAIADQLDMLWHAMDTGSLTKVDSFYNAIQAVKNEYPKAE